MTQKAQVPLDDYEIEKVLFRLDAGKEGKISYQYGLRAVCSLKTNILSIKERKIANLGYSIYARIAPRPAYRLIGIGYRTIRKHFIKCIVRK